jgi:hypothetical protein
MLRRDTIIIGGGATNRGVETSVREAFNLDLGAGPLVRILLPPPLSLLTYLWRRARRR